jgi:1,5-anhydro-D-fructose reductase (1,5-anhydro-D-mannitol-forming)
MSAPSGGQNRPCRRGFARLDSVRPVPATPELRVLVVGHGLIGRQRAASIHALSSQLAVSLAGTVDPAGRDPQLYDGAPHVGALTEMPVGDYDAAVVALPHDAAAEVTAELLGAGIPVLVEKPLGSNSNEAMRLATAADALKIPSFVGYNYRFLPHVQEIFQAVTSSTLGNLRSIDLLIGHGGHPGSAEGWKLDPKRAGGGVLLDPGVHLLDLLLQLDGRLQPLLARGSGGFWGTGIEEDLVVVLASGALQATVRVSHVRWVNTLRLEVVGDDGYAIAEGRGGNYGPMTVRIGTRWAWKDDPEGRGQRETEYERSFGGENRSLEDETAAVLRTWLGEPLAISGPRPCSMSQAVSVARLVDDLYARMGEPVGSEINPAV